MVKIELSGSEALVLYAWLSRLNAREDVEFEDQAEQRVLWDIEAVLESSLAAPLRGDFESLVSKAREEVRDPVE